MLGSQERTTNFGLLTMRVGLAGALFFHTLPKLISGAQAWHSVGTMLAFVNVGLPPTILGLSILVIEALGAVSLLFGYFFRISCIVLFMLFGLYFFNYFSIDYKTLMLWSIGIAAVFLGLFFIGPGRYALTLRLEKK